MELKILLVDDEPEALDLLECLLINKNGVKVAGKALTAHEAIEKMIELQPDVIFQDIQMGAVSGLELVDKYRQHHYKGKIVFVTAYAEYAIEAIRKAAFDYLLKPVDQDELTEHLLRLMAEHRIQSAEKPAVPKKLKIPTRMGFILVKYDDIVFLEAEGNYTGIVTFGGERVVTSHNLGKMEQELLPDTFCRISRSAIINTHFLSEVVKGERLCKLKADNAEYHLHISYERIKALEAFDL